MDSLSLCIMGIVLGHPAIDDHARTPAAIRALWVLDGAYDDLTYRWPAWHSPTTTEPDHA